MKIFNKDGKKQSKIKSKIKSKLTGTLLGIVIMKIIPILLISSIIFTAVSWVVELINAENNPKKLYEEIGENNLNQLIAIAGNSLDGYYVGYKEGLDAKLEKVVKEYKKAGYKDISKKLLLKMIQAELYTQYPNLEGKIGHEIKMNEEKNKDGDNKDSKINSLDDFLFIGDSITVGLEKHIDAKHIVKAQVGVGANYWLDHFNEFPESDKVKGINICLGTNDYGDGIDNIKKLIVKLHKKYPKNKIFIDNLLPDNSTNVEKNKRKIYIDGLKAFCKEQEYLIFIDPSKDIQMGYDGIHPKSEEEYRKLWENIKNEILKNDANINQEPKLLIGQDTGKGRKGFQGGVKIRRVTPDKKLGEFVNVGGGELTDGTVMSGEYVGIINNYLIRSGAAGEWAVYAKNLNNGKELAMLNSQKKNLSANFIDLFIMAVAYEKNIEDEELIERMMTKNDKNATDQLIDKIGIEKINEYLKNNGYNGTQVNTKVVKKETGKNNYTSPSDVGNLLEKIYNKKCVSKKASEKMIEYLKNQKEKDGIPAGIDKKDKVEIGNKVGREDLVQNDAGIVYKDGDPYVLVVMGSSLENAELGKKDIKEISKIIYDKVSKKNEKEEKEEKEVLNVKYDTSIKSKVYDMIYISQEEFDKKIEAKDKDILKYYTLDGDWKLITAKWSYSDDSGLEFQKNASIDYKSALKKYMTPFEYLMNYYIDIKDERFINDFANLIMDSEFVISVQDNVTTTDTKITIETVYDNPKYNFDTSRGSYVESVSTNIDLTYIDTWFVKFWKDIDYTQHFGTLYHGEYVSEKQKAIIEKARSGKVKAKGRVKEEDWVEKVYKAEGYKIKKYCCPSNAAEEALALGGTDKEKIPVGALVFGDLEKGRKCTECDKHKGMVGIYVGNGEVSSYSSKRKRGVVDKLDDWIDDFGWSGWGWYPGTENIPDANVNVDSVTEKKLKLSGKVEEKDNQSINVKEGEPLIILEEKKYTTEAGGNVTEYIKKKINSQIITTTNTHSISNKYETGESHITGNEKKFLKLFADNPEALESLTGDWLLDLMENNERTASMLDLTKYLLYCLDNKKYNYGVTEFNFEQFYPSLNKVNSSRGMLSLTKPTLSREKFIEAMQAYGPKSGNKGFIQNFMPYAAEIYDTSVEANVNPELVVVTAKAEQNFIAGGGANNYWGIGVYNGSQTGSSFATLFDGIRGYADVIRTYDYGGSQEAAIMQRYNERKDSGCDPLGYGLPGTLSGMQSVYSFLGNHEPGSSGAGGYYYMDPAVAGVTKIYATHEEFVAKCLNGGSEHAPGTKTTPWEQGQYTAWQLEEKMNIWKDIFGEYGSLSGSGGITTDEEARQLQEDIEKNWINTVPHKNYESQGGPFEKYWDSPYNVLEKYQCTWWAFGRASKYLEGAGGKYSKYPTQQGNGGEYYDINKANGWFNYGSEPKPNSIISWKDGNSYGHVAYVEGVGIDGIYISHAGSGSSWFGVQKIPLDGSIWRI